MIMLDYICVSNLLSKKESFVIQFSLWKHSKNNAFVRFEKLLETFSGFVPKLVARLAIIEQINIIALNSWNVSHMFMFLCFYNRVRRGGKLFQADEKQQQNFQAGPVCWF